MAAMMGQAPQAAEHLREKWKHGLGGGFKMFQTCFTFTPTWGNDPIWLQMG